MNVKVKWIKPPARIGFAYFMHDECMMEKKQADELAEAGYLMILSDDSMLPADIPAREALTAAGINSMEQLAGITDFTEIAGINKATAKKITLYLSELK